MATTRLYLDTRRHKNGGRCPLKIAIAHRGTTAYFHLNIYLDPVSEWDSKHHRIKNHPQALQFNTRIRRINLLIDSMILELLESHQLNRLTAIELRNLCEQSSDPRKKQEKEAERTFLFRFNRYASRMKAGSRRIFDHTLSRLTAFIGEKALSELRFEDLTYDWLCRFDAFMAKTAPSVNSRNIHYRNMRAVINEAIDDGITTHYPFRRFKIKNIETAKRDLTVEGLRRLIFFKCEECAVKYRDYFVLMFYLIGINNVDLCNLREMNGDRVEYNRAKTSQFYSIRVEPEAMTLIRKYRGNEHLIDILDHWDSDEFFRKKMNKHLKRIGPVSFVNKNGKKEYKPMFPKITTYWSRHTWASIASDLDIPDRTIAEALGHETGNRTTNIYIHYNRKKVDAANRKIIDWVLYGIRDGKEIVRPGTPEFFGLTEIEAIRLGLVAADERAPSAT